MYLPEKSNSAYISSDKTIILFFLAINANASRLLCVVPEGLFGEFKIKYWKDEKETIYSHEYLVYENLSNSSIHNIELITKPA